MLPRYNKTTVALCDWGPWVLYTLGENGTLRVYENAMDPVTVCKNCIINHTYLRVSQRGNCFYKGAVEQPVVNPTRKRSGELLQLSDKCTGFFYVHSTTLGLNSLTFHLKDEAVIPMLQTLYFPPLNGHRNLLGIRGTGSMKKNIHLYWNLQNAPQQFVGTVR